MIGYNKTIKGKRYSNNQYKKLQTIMLFSASPTPYRYQKLIFNRLGKKIIITRYMKTQGGEFTLVLENVYHLKWQCLK